MKPRKIRAYDAVTRSGADGEASWRVRLRRAMVTGKGADEMRLLEAAGRNATAGAPRRGKGREDGLTLVEIVTAMAVIATALLGHLSMVIHSIQSKEARRESTLARRAAVAQLETIKSVADPTDGTTFSDYVVLQITGSMPTGTQTTHEFSVEGLTHASTSDKKGKGTVVFNTSNPDIVEVSIDVDWDGVRPDSKVHLKSLVGKGYTP